LGRSVARRCRRRAGYRVRVMCRLGPIDLDPCRIQDGSEAVAAPRISGTAVGPLSGAPGRTRTGLRASLPGALQRHLGCTRQAPCGERYGMVSRDQIAGSRTGLNRCDNANIAHCIGAVMLRPVRPVGPVCRSCQSADGGRRRHWSRSQTEISILSFVDVVRYSARSTSARPRGEVPGPVALPPRTGHRETAVG
jgi:hypothetical protein